LGLIIMKKKLLKQEISHIIMRFEKAKQYAKLANLEVIKTIKISEFEPRGEDYENNRNSNIMICGSADNSTELPVGEIDIETKLFCDFLAK